MNFSNLKRKCPHFEILTSLVIALIIFSITTSLVFLTFQTIKNDEIIKVTQKYVNLNNEIENFISRNSSLIKGFSAYIQTFDIYSDEKVYNLFEYLLEDEMDLIRNVTILEDTTITWVYPFEENSNAIGIDLSKVEGQSWAVLEVKNKLKPIFHGPIDLVQDGKGFIIRVPILKNQKYWGMASIVLKGDVAFEFIKKQEQQDGLRFLVVKKDDITNVFYGNPDILKQNPIVFKNDHTLADWDIYAVPIDGWRYNDPIYLSSGIFICLIISLALFHMILKFIRNYSRFQVKHSQLEISSTKDPFTGIYNRGYFDSRIIQEISQADRHEQPLSIIYFDLDNFKPINDTFGHSEGDKVLISVTKAISNIVRTEDLFARWGGDEFVLLMPNTSLNGAMIVAEKIRSTIENLEFNLPFEITSSIGVSERVRYEYWASWFRRTDAALYFSKKNGRNQISASEHLSLKNILTEIQWKNEWLSGNKIIDKEHMELLDFGNKVIEYSFNVTDKKACILKIRELIYFALKHFKHEENELEMLNYPNLKQHKNIHNQIIKKFDELISYIEENDVDVDYIYNFFFNTLMVGHVLSEDSKFFAYTNKK